MPKDDVLSNLHCHFQLRSFQPLGSESQVRDECINEEKSEDESDGGDKEDSEDMIKFMI